MTTGVDPLATAITVLSTNWNPVNTSNKIPIFKKITDVKRYDFNQGDDVIFIQRSLQTIVPAGVGEANKHETDTFNTDIRIIGAHREQHFFDVYEEVKRIYHQSKVSPSADYDILEFDGVATDLSDKTHHLFRVIIPTQLIRYNIPR